ncbi:MAG: MATE family efflux transporter, partial [Spirochaetales bacterium]|nr:MATE family efflux transporter [Spirochaetales bacterium]
LAASVLISVVCFAFRYPIMHALNTPPESFSYAMDYMVTCIVGLVFIYGYNIVSAVLRGMGDSKRPFVFVGVAAILNIILDYLFVVVFDMEVFGAALATVIGQGVSFVSSLIYLYIKRQSFGFDFRLRSFAIHSRSLKPLIMLGIPMAIQSAAVNFSKVLLMSWINLEGVLYSALAGIFNKINVVGGVVSMSFTAAGSSMVGQNLGAKKYERIPRILATIAVIGLALFSVMTVVIVAVPEKVFGMFTGDVAVLSLANILIIPMILNFYGAATRSISFALINGSGNTRLNLAVALIDGILMRIGLAALLCFSFNMGSLGCWYGDAIAGFMPLLIGLVFYLSGKWRK